MNSFEQIALAGLIVWNIIGFLIAVRDKFAAKKKSRRTPEKTFVLLSATFAGPGVLLAFYIVRHKTKHFALLGKVWFLTAVTYVGLAAFIYENGGLP